MEEEIKQKWYKKIRMLFPAYLRPNSVTTPLHAIQCVHEYLTNPDS